MRMRAVKPPRWLEGIAERALPGGLSGRAALGDLAEEFQRRAVASRLRARMWYAAQTASIVAYRIFTGSGADSQDSGSDLLMDVRWAFRLILKHPGFALGVVAVLGTGLGANVAVYSVVDGTFRNTSWWEEPDRTLGVWPDRRWSFGMMELYRESQVTFRSLGGYAELAYAVRTPDGSSESVNGVAITPELFRELAVQPALGRALNDDDALLGVEPVAVISESLWRRSFGSDPAVLGSAVDISGTTARVVGIQGRASRAPGGRAEVWLPLVVDPREDDYFKEVNLKVVGVLADGVTFADAHDEVDAFNDYLARIFPNFFRADWDDGLVRVARADASQRRFISTPLLLLLGGTALLLLVTALNVGNLLLGRAIERRQELAVRAAIGAGRGRIVQQLLVEALVLTSLAVAVALWTGAVSAPWIAGLFVGEAVVRSSSVLSPSVLGFSAAAAATAWVVIAGVPVLHFLRAQRSGPTLKPHAGVAVQRSLVAVQAALATLLLVAATLLVATVGNLRNVSLGFDAGRLLTVELSPPEDRVADAMTARGLYDALVERVSSIPGVESVGLAGWLPLREQAPRAPANLESAPVDQAEAQGAPRNMVDPGFFDVLGLEAVEGRLLRSEDRERGVSAVVVNQTLAETLWPDVSAVGQRIAIDPHMWETYVPVVGVVPDIRSGDITGPPGPAMYVSLAESPARDVTLLVRTASGAGGIIPAVRHAVADVDPLVPVRSVTWMDDVVRAAYAVSWVIMGLLVVLAVLATALGAIGIYAALSQHVAANRKDIGVRLALGAAPNAVVGEVVRSGVRTAGIGIAVGSVVAAMSARVLESQLFGVSTLAPWAYATAALALCAAAVLAAWAPAARAGSLPPAEVLRGE
ncbi:MAG: ABC transporter permease [Gemmatimonadota bacterium]